MNLAAKRQGGLSDPANFHLKLFSQGNIAPGAPLALSDLMASRG